MNFINKVWNKINKPHGILLALFYVVFICLISTTLTLVIIEPNQSIIHYILYLFSALALTYFVYTIVYFAPKIKINIIKILEKYNFTKNLLHDYGYRTVIFSIISFIFNISYVAFIAVLAFKTKSFWYISISVYYLILILVKGNIFYSKKRYNTERKRARAYRYCGIMFIFLTIAFSGVIVLIYTSNMYFEYAGLMIYAIAAYTFYKLTLAIINIFKARKHDDLYVQSIRNINLVTALISVIVLQVAMFQAFAPEYNKSIANGLTGGVVSLMILITGISMIVTANKKLKEMEVKDEIKE